MTSPIVPAATTTTPLAASSASTLAFTGTNVVAPLSLAGILFGLGALLTVVAAVRRRRLGADSTAD